MKIENIYFETLDTTIPFYIGKNAKDNFHIIDLCEPDDLWFHVHGQSSCHVIALIASIKDLEKNEIQEIIERGSLLCKENTFKVASLHNIKIEYTFLNNIQKTKTVGCVLFRDPGKVKKIVC
jgi:predicted ribosome quality control (RQC) complex YloA/Tae2 family protein